MSNSLDKHKYKTYRSEEVVLRPDVQQDILEKAGKKPKEIFILEGDRGAGKTTALLGLYKHYQSQDSFTPFFIGLFPYEAPEFARADNLWISSSPDGNLEEKDVVKLLRKMTDYLSIKFIKSLDDESQREYLSQELSKRQARKRLVLIVDSIYECSDETRRKLENYFLIPALSSNEVTIILSGRGRRPAWVSPEFRAAQIVPLSLFDEKQVKEQLEKFHSKHIDKWEKIKDWSGGCPLVVRILGSGDEVDLQQLSKAINILIQDALKPHKLEGQLSIEKIRAHIEKLSLFKETFRELEVVDYLFDPEQTDKRVSTRQVIATLLESNLLTWDDGGERRGLRLNETVAYPTQKWVSLGIGERLKKYHLDWEKTIELLSDAYPNVKKDEYRKMLTR